MDLTCCDGMTCERQGNDKRCRRAVAPTRGAMIKWRYNQNYCLSVDNNHAQPGAKMQLWTCADGSGQYFDLPPVEQHDYVRLHMNPAYCLVVDGNTNSNGAHTSVWTPCNQYEQQWTLAPHGSNEFAFQWALGGKCLVVDGNKAFNGAKVNIWDCASVQSEYKTWVVVGA